MPADTERGLDGRTGFVFGQGRVGDGRGEDFGVVAGQHFSQVSAGSTPGVRDPGAVSGELAQCPAQRAVGGFREVPAALGVEDPVDEDVAVGFGGIVFGLVTAVVPGDDCALLAVDVRPFGEFENGPQPFGLVDLSVEDAAGDSTRLVVDGVIDGNAQSGPAYLRFSHVNPR